MLFVDTGTTYLVTRTVLAAAAWTVDGFIGTTESLELELTEDSQILRDHE